MESESGTSSGKEKRLKIVISQKSR